MKLTKRDILAAPLIAALGLGKGGYAHSLASSAADDTAALPAAFPTGPFTSTVESLKTYRTPDWFRDAKFGIWSHWGPQAVPRQGDWYARFMYVPGHPHYDHHVKTYGHPSAVGYKDLIPLWTADRFDPDALMERYAAAGAKYFVSMGVHHDNFDLWKSRHQRWNATTMGPKRDIVGAWKSAAKRRGLRFGVSEHLAASYTWWHPSHLYDQFWPKLGVAYDGADPKLADLYHDNANEPFINTPQSWYTLNTAFHQHWLRRIRDLVDAYQPDLLYSDGGLPFGAVGRSLVAHLYNASAARTGGRVDAVYTCKDSGSGEFHREASVQDVERGVLPGINAYPWQTCTSNGDWFFNDRHPYKTVANVITMLADIVSKNGNLLLNVVQLPDGSLPPQSEQLLAELAPWIKVNGEAIHGTRPWVSFGEGPTETAAGMFKESGDYSARDIRFTTKGDTLYALTLGEPSATVAITALRLDNPHERRRVRKVRLLGHRGSVSFRQTDAALVIDVPPTLPTRHASAFAIDFA
ncbi:alpha-L-fucosidase [Sphingomonas sp. KR1UV-12]|uniref:alpha-L-fucosidase n=1 Tax=Sphingomonas aurea TaxID=3063994 RepID=A0ABT9EJ47_9SPHN|nr:alpha-L-fucosidase [Sphingomonas sp. KR1UV-12]MDP1026982.1 alpha-L-fucosidase [Sphingomonas sp. KR1UV-12]